MFNENQLMIDIETLATSKDAVVTAIGAVVFNTEDGIIDEFHVQIDPRKAQAAGLTIDADTVLWWMGQSPEAQQELMGKGDFVESMQAFRDFCLGKNIKKVFANDPGFDCDILRHAFEVASEVVEHNMPTPWRFWQERSCRTMFDLGELYGIDRKQPREGTHHNSLDDARHQANHVLMVLNALREHAPEIVIEE